MTSDRLKQLIRIWAGRRRCHRGNAHQRRQSSTNERERTEREERTFCTASAAVCRLTTVSRCRIVEAAQHQDHELESYRGDVSNDHHRSLGPPSKSTCGVGEEDVQPERCDQQVAQLSDRIEQRQAGPLQVLSWVTKPPRSAVARRSCRAAFAMPRFRRR